jgi:hypothetical protein
MSLSRSISLACASQMVKGYQSPGRANMAATSDSCGCDSYPLVTFHEIYQLKNDHDRIESKLSRLDDTMSVCIQSIWRYDMGGREDTKRSVRWPPATTRKYVKARPQTRK